MLVKRLLNCGLVPMGSGLIFVNSAEGKQLAYIGSSASNGNGLVSYQFNGRKEGLLALGSDSETGDGGIWIRNKNEELLIGLKDRRKIWLDKNRKNWK